MPRWLLIVLAVSSAGNAGCADYIKGISHDASASAVGAATDADAMKKWDAAVASAAAAGIGAGADKLASPETQKAMATMTSTLGVDIQAQVASMLTMTRAQVAQMIAETQPRLVALVRALSSETRADLAQLLAELVAAFRQQTDAWLAELGPKFAAATQPVITQATADANAEAAKLRTFLIEAAVAIGVLVLLLAVVLKMLHGHKKRIERLETRVAVAASNP